MTMKLRPPQILTSAQAVEALLIIDALGNQAGRAPTEIAGPLNELRTRLRTLINAIDNPKGGSGALLG